MEFQKRSYVSFCEGPLLADSLHSGTFESNMLRIQFSDDFLSPIDHIEETSASLSKFQIRLLSSALILAFSYQIQECYANRR